MNPLPPLMLLLAATSSALLLEPNPDPTLKALHPRKVTASSYLSNGWNQFEQNYLPPYVADDDPSTAWVEGVKGTGAGESILWTGPTLQKAKAYHLFVRNGYQKSQTLYAANARPKKIKLEPLLADKGSLVPAGAVMELELADKTGWQRVTLPVLPQVTGFRLTVQSVYPGTKYDDTCVSDLRVYVDGDDPYRADVEAAAMESIRRFSAERKQAAKEKGKVSPIELASAYTTDMLFSKDARDDRRIDLKSARQHLKDLEGRAELSAPLKKATAALEAFEAATRAGGLEGGWLRAKVSRLHKGGGGEVAFGGADWDFGRQVDWMHARNLGLFEAREAGKKAAARPTGEFVRGDLKQPQALFVGLTEDVGERDVVMQYRQRFYQYVEGRAESMVLVSHDDQTGAPYQVITYVLEWKPGKSGRDLLASVTAFHDSPWGFSVQRYRPE